MSVYPDYDTAFNAAVDDANMYNRPMGLEVAKEYGRRVWRVKMIPKLASQRFGWETRCQVVEPGEPKIVRMS
jgi:hypothetical protein